MYGLGFRVLDSWFVVYGSWLRVSSFRFQGSGLMVLSFLSSVYLLGLGVQGIGCRVLGLGFKYGAHGLRFGFWDLGFGVWGLGFRVYS